MSSFLPLNAKADVRAITFNPETCASRLMISSARPSEKYSSSASRLMLANGKTAMEGMGGCGAVPETGLAGELTPLAARSASFTCVMD